MFLFKLIRFFNSQPKTLTEKEVSAMDGTSSSDPGAGNVVEEKTSSNQVGEDSQVGHLEQIISFQSLGKLCEKYLVEVLPQHKMIKFQFHSNFYLNFIPIFT